MAYILYVKQLTGRTTEIKAECSNTVEELKLLVEEAEGIDASF